MEVVISIFAVYGPHSYTSDTYVGRLTGDLTREIVYAKLLEYATPTPFSGPVSDGQRSQALPGQYVITTIDQAHYSITNTTIPGQHFLDPGQVTRTVEVRNGEIFIHTVGTGTGLFPNANEALAPPLWQSLDLLASIEAHREASGNQNAVANFTADAVRLILGPDSKIERLFRVSDTGIRELQKLGDGSIAYLTHSLNSDGTLARTSTIFSDGTTKTVDYSYNAKGQQDRITQTERNGINTTTDLIYTADGKVSRVTTTADDLTHKTTVVDYTFDARGNLSRTTTSTTDGSNTAVATTDSSYNSSGDLTRETTTKSDGSSTTRDISYNANRDISRETVTDSNGKTTTTDLTYNSNRDVSRKTTTDSDGKVTTTDYDYNADHEPTGETTTHPDGSTTVTTYDEDGNETTDTFDKDGNLTKHEQYPTPTGAPSAPPLGWPPLNPAPQHDPLVLDLGGDGIQFIPLAASNAYYDFAGTGFAIKTGWIGPDDGFLVEDLGNNHIALFGNLGQDGGRKSKLQNFPSRFVSIGACDSLSPQIKLRNRAVANQFTLTRARACRETSHFDEKN